MRHWRLRIRVPYYVSFLPTRIFESLHNYSVARLAIPCIVRKRDRPRGKWPARLSIIINVGLVNINITIKRHSYACSII